MKYKYRCFISLCEKYIMIIDGFGNLWISNYGSGRSRTVKIFFYIWISNLMTIVLVQSHLGMTTWLQRLYFFFTSTSQMSLSTTLLIMLHTISFKRWVWVLASHLSFLWRHIWSSFFTFSNFLQGKTFYFFLEWFI